MRRFLCTCHRSKHKSDVDRCSARGERIGDNVGQSGGFSHDAGKLIVNRRRAISHIDQLVSAPLGDENAGLGELAQFLVKRAGGGAGQTSDLAGVEGLVWRSSKKPKTTRRYLMKDGSG